LDDLEDDTIGKLPVEFEDILKEKYPLYRNSTDSPDLNGWLNGEEVSILDIKILSTELPKEKTSILDQDLITFLGETVSDISYSSKSEARKAIKSGAVTINGIKILDGSALVRSVGVLHDNYILIRRGKKNYSLVKLEPSK
jgi:tyrosyl-tRNA synthetase